jgi:hypothetical protein
MRSICVSVSKRAIPCRFLCQSTCGSHSSLSFHQCSTVVFHSSVSKGTHSSQLTASCNNTLSNPYSPCPSLSSGELVSFTLAGLFFKSGPRDTAASLTQVIDFLSHSSFVSGPTLNDATTTSRLHTLQHSFLPSPNRSKQCIQNYWQHR